MYISKHFIQDLKLWACLFFLFIHFQVPLPNHHGLSALPHLHEDCRPERHEEGIDDGEIIIEEVSNIVEMARLMQRSDWTILGTFRAEWLLGCFSGFVANFTSGGL